MAREVNWLVDAPAVGSDLELQVRHRARPARGTLIRSEAGEVEIALEEAVSAITPGQSLVMYQRERLLGGGVIERGSSRALPVRAA